MNLQELQQNWEQLGKEDALWAVLSDPSKRGGRWDPEEFFATGEKEVAAVDQRVRQLGHCLAGASALDFGCGVGRLSQALASRYAEVHRGDISASMIELATRYGQRAPNCRFHLNTQDNLALFQTGSFDLAYSNIALMHMRPVYAKIYIREFVRVLKPGGLAVFQFLTPKALRALVPQALVDLVRKLKHGKKAFIPMYGIPPSAVAQILKAEGATVLQVDREPHGTRWTSLTFFAKKR